MFWPTPSDYQEALQNPRQSFSDPILKNAKPHLDNLGLPKAISGSFAIVFPVESNSRTYAVRCFLIESHEREKKYNIVTKYLKNLNLKYMVEFEYIENGIKIKNNWYPILKMEWVEGIHLNDYIRININDKNKITALEKKFLEMIKTLNINKIAHGDLHHQNILIKNDEFKLIDYDAMFVPGLEGMSCGEVGHRHYQHPLRTENDFGPYLDNFSAWEIFLSLRILSIDKNFWNISGAGEEYILFRQEDFDDISSSKLFTSLQSIQDEIIKGLMLEFESIIYSSIISEIPCINEEEIEKYKPLVTGHTSIEEENKIEQSEWIFEHLPVKQLSLTINLFKERILAILLTIINLINVYAIYQNYYPIIVGIGISSSGLLILIYVYLTAYEHIPIVVEKNIKQNNIKLAKNNIDSINDQIKIFKNNINNITSTEKDEIDKLNKKITDNKKEERDYLMNLEREFAKQLQNLTLEYSKTEKDEMGEIYNYTTNFREQYVNQQLSKRSISGARISGLGPALTARLNDYGFYTAADVIDFQIRVSRYINDNIANIKHRSDRWFHVPGIGPKTMENIRYWHSDLKRRIESTVPLPPSEEILKIKSKYINKRRSVEENKSKVKDQNERMKIDKIKYIRNANDNLSKQVQKIKIIKMNEKRINFDEIKKQEKLFTSIKWKHGELLHEFESFKKVTFTNYLKKIASIN